MESKPVFELHKTSEGFIITSDEEIKDRDFTLSPTDNTVFQMHKVFVSVDIGNYKKVIAQQDQIDFSALKEEEQKEIGWFDVASFASVAVICNGGLITTENEQEVAFSYYYQGFQKAQELLSDRRFTLEGVQLAFAKGAEYTTKPYPQNVQFENEYKQSLSQKSWKVEVEMELNLNGRNGLERASFIPKLTNGKIKILKLC
jgi:hypothetical protein